tara:strand:+ start:163 stop:1305 length:1143 start_codon:yes stop_codon:yes gene_type:complete
MFQLIKGLGSAARLKAAADHFGYKKILLVSGKKSYALSGIKQIIDSSFEASEIVHFSDFSINPKLDDARKGVQIALHNKVDLIVAVGGGSVMDMAKIIKALYDFPDRAEEICSGTVDVVNSNLPIIAIPTTAGSGSEATHFAVVYIKGKKYSLAHDCLKPNAVILDGCCVMSAPKYLKSCNVLDALSQAIESAWSVGSTDKSRNFAFESVAMCSSVMRDFVNGIGGEATAQKMLEGSNLAGQAIDISKTTAAHAWSYGFTSCYGIPHGHAVWLTLPKIFEIHGDSRVSELNDPRGASHLNSIMTKLYCLLNLSENSVKISTQLCEMLNDLGISVALQQEFALAYEDRLLLSKMINTQRMGNNPVSFSTSQVDYIFQLDEV